MQVITSNLISRKRVLLRLDLDVPIKDGKVIDDFRLRAGFETVHLSLANAGQVIIMGHIGRPGGKEIPELSVKSIYDWFFHQGLRSHFESGKLKILENLRFEAGESLDSALDPREENINFARDLARMGDVYVNEAFSAHHPAASTTILPTLLPSAAGLRFAAEVERLTQVRENPKRPLIVIIGGMKIEDKLPAIRALSKIADYVLVGGKLIRGITETSTAVEQNVMLGQLTSGGLDITDQTVTEWKEIIQKAKMVVWNGPVGKFEDPKNDQSAKLARIILDSGAETVVGGGDTVTLLDQLGLLDQFSFVSTGGGAMLKFLSEGTLPTIEALNGNSSN